MKLLDWVKENYGKESYQEGKFIFTPSLIVKGVFTKQPITYWKVMKGYRECRQKEQKELDITLDEIINKYEEEENG